VIEMDVETTQAFRNLDPAVIRRQSRVCAAIYLGAAIVLFALGCLLRTMNAWRIQPVEGTYFFFVGGAGMLVLAALMPSMGRLRAGFARIDRLLHAGGDLLAPPPSCSEDRRRITRSMPTMFFLLGLMSLIGMAIYSTVKISIFSGRIWFAFVGYAMLLSFLATFRKITRWRLDQILRRLGVNPGADTPCPDPYRRVRRRKIAAWIVWILPIFSAVIACLWLSVPSRSPEIAHKTYFHIVWTGSALGLSCLGMFELGTQQRFERIYHAMDFDCDIWSRQASKRMSVWMHLFYLACLVATVIAIVLLALVFVLLKEWTFAVHVWAMAMGYIMILAGEMAILRMHRLQLRAIQRHLAESAEDIQS